MKSRAVDEFYGTGNYKREDSEADSCQKNLRQSLFFDNFFKSLFFINSIKRETRRAQELSCEFCKFFKSTSGGRF